MSWYINIKSDHRATTRNRQDHASEVDKNDSGQIERPLKMF